MIDGASTERLEDLPRIFVLGTTNRPDAIDDAFRRPGRFDKEFEIGLPDVSNRLDILEKMLKKIPHEVTIEQLKDINAAAHGYVGADLAALCREAGLLSIKRLRNEMGDVNDSIIANHDDLKIKFEDLQAALKLVKPSTVREITVEVPKVFWKDIGGQSQAKQKLKEAVEWPIKVIKFNEAS